MLRKLVKIHNIAEKRNVSNGLGYLVFGATCESRNCENNQTLIRHRRQHLKDRIPPPHKKGYPLRHPFLSTPATLLSQAKTKQYFCEKCIDNATQFTQFSFTLFFCHKNLSEEVLVSLFVC